MRPINPPYAWVEASPSSGESEASLFFQQMFEQVQEHQLRPTSRGKKINDLWEILDKVQNDCKKPDWDGEGAGPLSQDAVNELKILFKALPLSSMTPDIVPEPTGGIGLEWRSGKDAILSLGLSGNGFVTYSTIIGEGESKYGTERFFGKIPSLVEETYLPFFSKEEASG